MEQSSLWLITWGFILVVLIVLSVIIYLLYKKLKVIDVIKETENMKSGKKRMGDEYFNTRLRNLEKKLSK